MYDVCMYILFLKENILLYFYSMMIKLQYFSRFSTL